MGCGTSSSNRSVKGVVAFDEASMPSKILDGKVAKEAWASPVPVVPRAVEDDAGGVDLPKEWTQKNQPSRPQSQKDKKSKGRSTFGWMRGQSDDSNKSKAVDKQQAVVALVADERVPRPWQKKPSVGTWLIRPPFDS
mmetsp:Transcript_57921/g.147049  ORF Transcript_57921/g.147049 Transcript_57921/m.147049 type:complete len:137 (-) Transcript_57921:176-586(-)